MMHSSEREPYTRYVYRTSTTSSHQQTYRTCMIYTSDRTQVICTIYTVDQQADQDLSDVRTVLKVVCPNFIRSIACSTNWWS